MLTGKMSSNPTTNTIGAKHIIIAGTASTVVALFIIFYCYCRKRCKKIIKKFENSPIVKVILRLGLWWSKAKLKLGLSSESVPDQNLAFYRNQIRSKPHGDYIENILRSWRGNYGLLESHHGYIQWLFPNRDPGVNSEASILTDKEAKIIRETPEMRNRVRRAFEMMLDLYGMRLTRENQFQLSENFYERLFELNQRGNHNFLRITRILNGLKELGHKDLMLPWMKFLARQIYWKKRLDRAESSFQNYWIETLDALDAMKLRKFMENKFV